jgi:hypothetical protein
MGLHPSKGGKRGWENPVWGTGILHAHFVLEDARRLTCSVIREKEKQVLLVKEGWWETGGASDPR